MSFINDPVLHLAKVALNGLSARRDVISQNIANVDTPDYRAQEVDFESALRAAMNNAERLPLKLTNKKHLFGDFKSENISVVTTDTTSTARADGNNVDIDMELVNLTETGLRYNTITNVVSSKYQLYKSIATGG